MKNYLVPAVIAAVVVVIGSFFLPKGNTIVQQLGATPGADFNFPCETHNGIQRCFTAVSMVAATTSVCSIKSPSATSTLMANVVTMSVSSSTASLVTIAKGTNTNATTTTLGNAVSVSANAQATIVASTTLANFLANDFVFAPNTYFNVGFSGGAGTFSPTGRCQATFESINPVNR